MELQDLKREIAELVQGMTALLDSNTRIGQELADAKEDLKKARKDLSFAKDDLSKANKKIDVLQSGIEYLKGKQDASNRNLFKIQSNRKSLYPWHPSKYCGSGVLP